MITIEQARQLYAADDTAHDFDHVLRVLALAERIAEAEGADRAIVRTAALLHDVAHDEPGHHLRGAERARQILADQPPAFVAAVAHAIEAHRFRAAPQPQTLEAQVLFDADKLDAIGAVGVARAFAHTAHQGQRLFVPLDEVDEQSLASGPGHTAVHEFVFKLARLRDLLYTKTAREIARRRHDFMVAFFQRLDAEARGEA
ncbi:MAG: HD domain-containing protein [Chloroflexi bacterium]|nr:HD domain-containing protein [Chloroflexota bacterium]